MTRTITDNPGGWSRSLPGHTVEYEPSFAQPFYYGTELVLGGGASSYYTLSFTDSTHIFFIDMIAICPQIYTEIACVVYVNDVPYVAAAGIGWLNIPLRQNPSIQLIAGDHIDVLVVNQDEYSRNILVKVNGTKIVRPANFGHAPGAYFTYTGPSGGVGPTALRLAEVSGSGNPAGASVVFDAVDCAGINKANGYLQIDLKASNPAIMTDDNAIEITSSGGFDVNEWAKVEFDPSVLTTDYQTFIFPLLDFVTQGGELNVAAINYMRWWNYTTGASVTLYWRNAYLYAPTNRQVEFTDGSTNSPTSWEWDFGDGSPVSNEQNPVHVYVLPGSYYPRLKVGNAYGYDFYGLSTPIVVT